MTTLDKAWCNFVLNEGVMPASIVRRIKNDSDISQDNCLLASILNKRDTFSDAGHPDLVTLTKTAFNNDQELTSWLAEMDNLLNIIVSFSNQKSMKDLLDGAYSSFIKACPWISNDIKNKYLQAKEPTSYSEIARAKNDLETLVYKKTMSNPKIRDFMIFLQKSYSPNTCNSYKTAVGNWGSDILGKDLWKIDDPDEMQDLYNLYMKTDAFVTKDINTRKTLSNGLKRYIEFLRTEPQND